MHAIARIATSFVPTLALSLSEITRDGEEFLSYKFKAVILCLKFRDTIEFNDNEDVLLLVISNGTPTLFTDDISGYPHKFICEVCQFTYRVLLGNNANDLLLSGNCSSSSTRSKFDHELSLASVIMTYKNYYIY